MHYYTRHIGDYAKDTGHLSLLEHGVYMVLLDWAYATERALPEEKEAVYRICRAQNSTEKRAVDKVVQEFFTIQDEGRMNKRAVSEINAFRVKSTKNRNAVLLRWKNERNTNVEQTKNERNTTRARVPLTNNQEPISLSGENHELPEVSVPSKTEVVVWARSVGVDPDWVARKWENIQGTSGWERNGRIIDWQRLFKVWFEEDVRLKRWKPAGDQVSGKNGGGISVAKMRFELEREIERRKVVVEDMRSRGEDFRQEKMAVEKMLEELGKLNVRS